MAKRTLVNWIAAKSFKPVDGGYLLVTSHPWLIGTGPAFIVTGAQKEALIAVMPPRRPLLVLVVALGVYVVGLCLAAKIILAHVGPIAVIELGMVIATAATMYSFMVVMIRRKLRRMAPILANAKPMLSAGEAPLKRA